MASTRKKKATSFSALLEEDRSAPRPPGVTAESEAEGLFENFALGESAWYRQGAHWSLIVKHGLWRDAHCGTALEFLTQEAERRKVRAPKLEDLSRDAAVADRFDEAVAVREGKDRLLRLITIRKQAGRPDDVPREPADERIDIPQPDSTVLHKRFADCTEKDLRAALASSKRAPLSKDAEAFLAELTAVAPATPGVGWSLHPRKDQFALTLVGPLDSLRAMVGVPPTGKQNPILDQFVAYLRDKLAPELPTDAPTRFFAFQTSQSRAYYWLARLRDEDLAEVLEDLNDAANSFSPSAAVRR